MLKKISTVALAAAVFLPSHAVAESQLDSLSTAFGTGTISGQIGANFRINEAKDDDSDGSIGTGYLELGYLTNEFGGARFGAYFIGAGDLWARKSFENAFDDGQAFTDKAMLRDIYIDYSIPGSSSQLLVGRKQFDGSPVMDGDVHQGVQLTIGEIKNLTVYASLINRWVDNASTAYDMDGIDASWRDGDDVVAGASDTVFSLVAEAALVPEMLNVTPFIVHQNDVVTTYGTFADLSMSIGEGLNAGLDGIFAVYDEDTAASDDEDANSYLIHGSISAEKWKIGLGYYFMSDDVRVSHPAIGNDTFDPMEEGVYGGVQDDNTIYIDAEYTCGPLTASLVLGDTEVDRSGDGATEFDFYLTYAISDKIAAELMFVDVNDDDSAKDYQVYAGTVNFSF